MEKSLVQTSMRDENGLGCSYAIISKEDVSVIVILRDRECGIFDYGQLLAEDASLSYLLLKHYDSDSNAYRDFLKLIGKMCKKSADSKYFRNHLREDNRMVSPDGCPGHMLRPEENAEFQDRLSAFLSFVLLNRKQFH